MNVDRFDELKAEILDKCCKILDQKKSEYTQGNDRLDIFAKASNLNNCSIQQALFGMVTKQIVSLANYINEDKDLDQNYEDKLVDIINYMIFLYAMNKDEFTNAN
ncbi:MAG: hypothetical protein KAH01_07745 [Caldisericia bacterium]|nr:hypothetical protein [Caldisericia bacterium]